MTVDLIIAGGGPAGLATAIYARRAGLSAVVLERHTGLDKPCGEGLAPAGARTLAEMGVEMPVWGRMPFVGIRYLDGETIAEGRFVGGVGLGVRRTALTEALRQRAVTLGADLRLGTRFTGWRRLAPGQVAVETSSETISGRLLVGADGLHSSIRRSAGLEVAVSQKRPPRFGVRRHFAVAPWSEFVEVHWHDEAEAYVTPVGPQLVGVAFLWQGKNDHFESLLARFPRLQQRLAGAEPASPAKGAGPFCQPVRRRYAADLALVGDAAGYLDPLTGEGMTLGFRSARALVETVVAGAPLAQYERRYRTITRSYYRMTGLLLNLAARPQLRRRVIAALARRPDLFAALLAVNAGERSLASLPLGALGGLAFAIARG